MLPVLIPVVYIEVLVMLTLTVLSLLSKRQGWAGGKVSVFTSRINLLPARNRSFMANNPATESTPVQGRAECEEPSSVDLPLHLRVTACRFLGCRDWWKPGPWPPDLHLMFRKWRKVTPRECRQRRMWQKGGTWFWQF